MYREPHLTEKNSKCNKLWYDWFELFNNPETKNTKKLNRCLSAFDNVEEVKSNEWSGKKYSVTKGNKKFFVKVKM